MKVKKAVSGGGPVRASMLGPHTASVLNQLPTLGSLSIHTTWMSVGGHPRTAKVLGRRPPSPAVQSRFVTPAPGGRYSTCSRVNCVTVPGYCAV